MMSTMHIMHLGHTSAAVVVPQGRDKVEYTCPMHPRSGRWAPATARSAAWRSNPSSHWDGRARSPELRDFERRLWIAAVLTLPVFVMEMGASLQHPQLPRAAAVELATDGSRHPWCCGPGLPFFERAWVSLKNRSPNMFTLVALGTGAALAYSMVATLRPSWFPEALRGHDGSVPVYFEASAVITVLVLLGQVLELRAERRRVPSGHCWAWRPRDSSGSG